jgi:NADPH-dependent curcumin reductase CurA
MPTSQRQIQLAAIPTGKLGPEHFRLTQAPMPTAGEAQLVVRVLMISLDAANRAWMQGATYRSALEAGQVMAGGALAEVVEAHAPGFAPGDLIFADTGWQEYAAVDAARVQKVQRREPLSHLLSVYGIAGLTAYFGLLRVGRPKAGETVAVSAAAGSVGSFVGQIARIHGCRVVGIAGGSAKCDWLRSELGFDAAVDYKAGALPASLKASAPAGIDVYFDNVGGDVLEACLFRMNSGGRIACCGAVSQYDGAPPSHGPRGIPGLIVTKRLTMQGFIVYDFASEYDTALAELEGWVRAGRLKVPEDVIEGLEQTPAALIGLLAGENVGKRMVRLRH